MVFFSGKEMYCWWFRNPANQVVDSFFPLFTGFLDIPGGFLAGFLNHQRYVSEISRAQHDIFMTADDSMTFLLPRLMTLAVSGVSLGGGWGWTRIYQSSSNKKHTLKLVGGLNPFEKYESNWIISPIFGAKKKKRTQLSCHHAGSQVQTKKKTRKQHIPNKTSSPYEYLLSFDVLF